MENLLLFLEPSIKTRIDELNETVEPTPDIGERIIANQEIFDKLMKVLDPEHKELLFDYHSNYGYQLVAAEDVYYRKGFVDGMAFTKMVEPK